MLSALEPLLEGLVGGQSLPLDERSVEGLEVDLFVLLEDVQLFLSQLVLWVLGHSLFNQVEEYPK